MSIKLVDSLQSMGDFPVAFANSIECADGTDLETKLSTLGSGTGGTSYIELSEEEYFALSDEERASEVEYRTYDTGRIFKRGVEFGKDGVQIDDVTASENTVWSSQKTSDEIAKVDTELNANLDELENITRLTDFDEAIPEKGKNKIYYVNKLLGTYKCAHWRVESMYYDVSGAKQYRGVQKATSINGVDNIMLMREYYLDDNNVMRWGAWTELATMDKLGEKLYINNSSNASVKYVKIASAPINGSSIDIHFKSARTNTTFEEETVRISKYISKPVYDGKIIQKSVYASNGNTPDENEANFLVTLDDYSVWAHIASYSTAEIELYSYGRTQSIDGTEATTLPSEVKYSMFNGAELATMDKIALKQECFDKKVTLTDSNWKYKKLTFTKSYMNTPSVNVSCGDYLNPEFYSYWGCEAYIININNEGCTIRYRSSKASESEPLEVNIIVFVNGI